MTAAQRASRARWEFRCGACYGQGRVPPRLAVCPACDGTSLDREAPPIALTRWLASLLLPPAEYAPRRILVPFAGVASEAIGAALAGWEEVVGVDLSPEYVAQGAARARWHLGRRQLALFGEED